MPRPVWQKAESAARAHRHLLGLGVEPINIWDQTRSSEVDLARHEFGDPGPDGMYLKFGDRRLIVVNSSKHPARQRWTCAHELGHHVMHGTGASDIAFAEKDVFANNDDAEKEANAFAAYFLAPTEAVVSAWKELSGEAPGPLDVVRVMARFGTSYEATLWRLLNSGAINESQRQQLQQEGAGNITKLCHEIGYDESAVFTPGPELPESTLVEPTIQLWASRGITAARMAELLRTDEQSAIDGARSRGVILPSTPEPDLTGIEDLFDESDGEISFE